MSASSRDNEPPHQFNIDLTPTSSTLAELILTHISPPGSPASLSSAPSRSRTDSIDDSSDEELSWSSDPERERSRGLGSTGRSGTGNGNSRRRQEAELVMPSMHLLSPGEFDSDERDPAALGPRTRILLVGRSEEERSMLARLLLAKQLSSTDDLSQSIISHFDSTRSGSNESTSCTIEGAELIGEGDGTMLFQPANTAMSGDELAEILERPYQRLERMLNPSFPSTVGLENHVNSLVNEEIDSCLMLFSSRQLLRSRSAVERSLIVVVCHAAPTQSEIILARAISHVLPLLPILLLPPSSKPQKTHVLVSAVSDQLTVQGVRWIPASIVARKYTEKDRPLFLLPHSLFSQSRRPRESYPSSASGFSSMTSSLELPPLPFSPASKSPSPTHRDDSIDLSRLQDLGSTASSRELLKRQKTRSFLDWREVELASRGERIWTLDELPLEWREVAMSDGEKEKERSLRFSQRVAERRSWRLERTRTEGLANDRCRDLSIDDAEEVEDEAAYAKDRRASSTYTDPTTPLCRPLPLDTFCSHSASRCSSSSLSDNPSDSLNFSYFPTVQSTSVPHFASDKYSVSHDGLEQVDRRGKEMVHPDDPFHFPSLLHLVGLNLRMSLLPTSAYSRSEQHGLGFSSVDGGGSTLRWVGTVAICSAVFLAGMLSGRAGGYVLNLFLSERSAVRY